MAKQPMLKFVNFERQMPEKRIAGVRNKDFLEIYSEFAGAKAEEQASRCSQCGVPYCQSHCPLHNNIPDWLKLTAEDDCRKPMKQVRQQTPFQKYVEEFVLKIACVRATALLSNRVMRL